MNAKEGWEMGVMIAAVQAKRGAQPEDDCRSEVAITYHLGVLGLLIWWVYWLAQQSFASALNVLKNKYTPTPRSASMFLSVGRIYAPLVSTRSMWNHRICQLSKLWPLAFPSTSSTKTHTRRYTGGYINHTWYVRTRKGGRKG